VLAPARSSEKGSEPQEAEPTKAEAEEQNHDRTRTDPNPKSTLAPSSATNAPNTGNARTKMTRDVMRRRAFHMAGVQPAVDRRATQERAMPLPSAQDQACERLHHGGCAGANWSG
jgi:hypothetical protein